MSLILLNEDEIFVSFVVIHANVKYISVFSTIYRECKYFTMCWVFPGHHKHLLSTVNTLWISYPEVMFCCCFFKEMWSFSYASDSLNELTTTNPQALLPAICGPVGYCSRRIFGSSNPSTCWRQLSSSFSFMAIVKEIVQLAACWMIHREGQEILIFLTSESWVRGYRSEHQVLLNLEVQMKK